MDTRSALQDGSDSHNSLTLLFLPHHFDCPSSKMSQESPPAEAPVPPKAKAKANRGGQPADIKMNVADYIEEERLIGWTLVRVAQQLLYGQIREIDPIHVKMLVHDFESNPPLSLELLVWKNPGALLRHVSILQHCPIPSTGAGK